METCQPSSELLVCCFGHSFNVFKPGQFFFDIYTWELEPFPLWHWGCVHHLTSQSQWAAPASCRHWGRGWEIGHHCKLVSRGDKELPVGPPTSAVFTMSFWWGKKWQVTHKHPKHSDQKYLVGTVNSLHPMRNGLSADSQLLPHLWSVIAISEQFQEAATPGRNLIN